MNKFIKFFVFFVVLAVIIVYFLIKYPDFFSNLKKGDSFLKPASWSQKTAPSRYAGSSLMSAPTSTSRRAGGVAAPAKEQIPDYLIPKGYSRQDLSFYFQKARIGSVNISQWGNYPSAIRLYSSFFNREEKIDISGWKIKSNRNEMIIGKAVEIYSPTGDNAESGAVLSSGASVNIYEGKSPLGRNFRLNKCMGYLNGYYDFNPDLPQNCPSIPRSDYAHLSGNCQNYITSLWGCRLPETSFYNSLPGTNEGNACRAFLNTIGYGTCFKNYKNDGDFLSNEWRFWADIDMSSIFDGKHDRIRLFDKSGLLVDEYIY